MARLRLEVYGLRLSASFTCERKLADGYVLQLSQPRNAPATSMPPNHDATSSISAVDELPIMPLGEGAGACRSEGRSEFHSETAGQASDSGESWRCCR